MNRQSHSPSCWAGWKLYNLLFPSPSAIRFLIRTTHFFYGIVCLGDVLISWWCLLQLSGRPTAHHKHCRVGKPFIYFFFLCFVFFNINPRWHWELLCDPMVCLLCLSAAAHLFSFYSLCFSLGSVYAWLGPTPLKWWRGVHSVWDGNLLFVWGFYGYCFHLLSVRSSWIQMCEEN